MASIPRRRPAAVPTLLVLCSIVVGLAWSLATAPLNGPDEAAHVSYVQHLAETGDGPRRTDGRLPYSTELLRLREEAYLRPIVGHAVGVPPWSVLGPLDEELGKLPQSQRADGEGPNPLASNPPLYYAYEAVAYRLSPSEQPLNRLFVLRLANVALFALTVLLTWLLACEIFTRRWPAVLATGLVAFQPKLGFMAGVVNSDTLLVTVTTAFLLASVRLVRRGPSTGRAVAVGLLAAAGPMTHGRGFALVPAGITALALGLWPARRNLRSALLPAALASGVLAAGILVGVLWTRGHSGDGAFGGELGRAGESGLNVRQFLSYVWQFYFDRLSFMSPSISPPYGYRQMYIETFFGTFGSLEVAWPGWVSDLIQLAAALGLAAFGAAVLLRWESVVRHGRIVLVAVATAASYVVLLHVTAYRHLAAGSDDPLITGRYLLPLVALYALAAAWTTAALARRAGPWIGAVLLAASLLATTAGVGLTAWRFGV